MSTLALKHDWNSHKPDDHRQQLFNELIGKYALDLKRYALWLAKDRHIAEDLVQEALLRAWRSIDRLQDPKAAKGWLLTILRRENARRFERKQLTYSEQPVENLRSARADYDTSTEAFVLRQAMATLPEKYRLPLVKQVIGGYSQNEIAEELGITPAGVGSRLFRARNQLKAALAV